MFLIYGSYFEWWFHKYLFHSPKLIKRTFKEHTLIHHQVYKGDHTYTLGEGKEPVHVAMDWWALVLFLGVHILPIFALQKLTGWQCLWGGLAAIATYYGIYEYFHWCMHVPNQRPFEKWRVYRYILEHHRLHHVHMMKNLNVILPIADLTLGTYKAETKRKDVPAAAKSATASTASKTVPVAPKVPAQAASKGK